jgi:hypothetical protein
MYLHKPELISIINFIPPEFSQNSIGRQHKLRVRVGVRVVGDWLCIGQLVGQNFHLHLPQF